MKKSEALRKQADMMDLVEGTGLQWWECVKLDYEIATCKLTLQDKTTRYDFALAIVEGRPVFEGDELYYEETGIKWRPSSPDQIFDTSSRQPPRPKTVMVELLVEDAVEWEKIKKVSGSNPIYDRLGEASKKAIKGEMK